MRTPILLAGPTASGKSATALTLARTYDGIIINADATQVYDCWHVLSARPSAADMAEAPHALYGTTDPQTPYSAGQWLADVQAILADTDKTPIIVGGTGLYFQALVSGLSPIPATPEAVRQTVEALYNDKGLAFVLEQLDAQTRQRIDQRNPARVLRALEVYQATGRTLAQWHDQTPPVPVLPLSQAKPYVLIPDRTELYARCDARVHLMLEQGAAQEVERALARNLSPDLPAMKAVGVSELTGYINGDYDRTTAIEQMQQATRNYAKRQLTWINNKMKDWTRL